MKLIKTEEVIENGLTYIVETFDNGTINKYLKPEILPEPQPKPITLEDLQDQIKELQEQSTTTGEQVAEMYAVQTGDVVVKSELDAAYREGVNAYAE